MARFWSLDGIFGMSVDGPLCCLQGSKNGAIGLSSYLCAESGLRSVCSQLDQKRRCVDQGHFLTCTLKNQPIWSIVNLYINN